MLYEVLIGLHAYVLAGGLPSLSHERGRPPAPPLLSLVGLDGYLIEFSACGAVRTRAIKIAVLSLILELLQLLGKT